MQALLNFVTAPGVAALLGVVLGISLKGLLDIFGENRRLKHESRERRAQWDREAEERQEQRAHEERLRQSEDQDRRNRAYARFLGMAHTVRHGERLSVEELRALAESYAEADVAARRESIRSEAYDIFQEALGGYSSASLIDTDAFIAAVRRETEEES